MSPHVSEENCQQQDNITQDIGKKIIDILSTREQEDFIESHHLCIGRASVKEREEIAKFEIKIHLDTATTNEERELQIKDLESDFPALYSDEAFEESNTFTLRSKETNQLVGVFGYDLESDHLYIRMVSLDPEWRGKQIGGFMTDLIINHAKQYGFKMIKLVTVPHMMPAAYHTYLKRGFVDCEIIPAAFHVVVMKLDL